MKRKLFESLNDLACSIRKNQIYTPNSKSNKANIGCGVTITEGWINVDATPHAMIAKWPKFILKQLYKISNVSADDWHLTFDEYYGILRNNVFIHHRIENGMPFPDNSLDYVYTSHMVEHLYKETTKMFLKEVFRTLRPNGIIRISIPDLEYAFKQYQLGNTEECLRLFFVPTHFNQLFQHHYLYDFNLLKKFLNEAGFEKVTRCEYQKGNVPDAEKLDVHPNESLYVEAQKT